MTRFPTLIILFILASCTIREEPGTLPGRSTHALADSVRWIEGTWVMTTRKDALYEQWARENDTLLTGRSFLVRKTDTIPLETIRLVQEGDSLFYIPTVPDQNEGKPVRFTLIRADSGRFIFANPGHDFPQKIVYQLISDDSITAVTEGNENGTLRRITFGFRRVR